MSKDLSTVIQTLVLDVCGNIDSPSLMLVYQVSKNFTLNIK
jgi:hypothetical protein